MKRIWIKIKYVTEFITNFDIINLMRDYEEIINRIMSKRYVQKRRLLRKIISLKKLFAFMNQKQRSSSSKFISKISSLKIASFEKILIKFIIIIFFSVSSITSLHQFSQKTFISFLQKILILFQRSLRLLLLSFWM